MISKTWSISALAVELDLDRRALARRLDGLKPHSEKTVGKRTERLYKLAAVVSHLYANGRNEIDLNQERGRLAVLQQEKLQLEIAELRGHLVKVSAVEARWQDLCAAMRAKLLSLPGKLAIAVAPPDKVQIAQDRSQALVYEALSELSQGSTDDQSAARRDRLADEGCSEASTAADDLSMG